MKKLLLSVILLTICLVHIVNAQTITPTAGIVYVKKGITIGNFTGSSWANAVPELANALKAAKTNTAIAEIWVGGGVYKPLYSPADDRYGTSDGRNNAFLLVKNVKVYGGFSGSESTLTQRNLTLTANRSTLSGDLDNSGGWSANDGFHVVISAGQAGTAELNGFTIVGSNSNYDNGQHLKINNEGLSQYNGGGMTNISSSPILSNLTISGNNAASGSGMSNSFSSPMITNVIISGNNASNGSGMDNYNSSPVLINVAIVGNNVYTTNGNQAEGAGMSNASSSPLLINVTISGNLSTQANLGSGRAAGIYNWYTSKPIIYNSIICNNNSQQGSAGVVNGDAGSVVVYKNSLVEGNPAGTDMVVYNGSPGAVFTNHLNPGLNNGGDYSLRAGSLAINKGNNLFLRQNTDLAAAARIRDNTVDIGAYEFQTGTRSMVVVPDANGIIYVKPNGAGNLTGSSWANATPELADALKYTKTNNALTSNAKVNQIWAAGGVYKPLYRADNLGGQSNTDRDNAFVLVSNVKIYGGFVGTETTLEQRNLNNTGSQSVLSGDFNGDDITTGTGSTLSLTRNAENAYHVVIAAGAGNGIELNGFTIAGGNASGSSSIIVNDQTLNMNYGGGVYNYASLPLLANIKILGNNSSFYGGGMYNSSAVPVLNKVSLSGNSASIGGGGMANSNSPTILNEVSISGNISGYGGGMFNSASSPVLRNVLLTGNHATSIGGGGMYNSSASPILTNVTISGNTATNLGSELYQRTSPLTVGNSIIFGSGASPVAFAGGGLIQATYSLVAGNPSGTGNINSDIYAVDQIFNNPSAGDFTPRSGSPAVNAGSNALFAGLNTGTKDLVGNMRLQKDIIDMGAFESPYSGILNDANGIVYVKKGATGAGMSWTNAIGELADALVAAKTNTNIRQIWVAAGIYKPLYSAADDNFGNSDGRNNTFLLVNNVQVYGGFAGTENTLAQRKLTITSNQSTLSGDFNGNDVVTGSGATLGFAGTGENAYHVVVSAGDLGTAELNGFTVSGGNANGNGNSNINSTATSQGNGGGIVSTGGTWLVVAHVLISGNSAIRGGGMQNTDSWPMLSQVILSNNHASSAGGGMQNIFSDPTLNQVVIKGNNTSGSGGGIHNNSSSPRLNNLVINNNNASYVGGGMSSSNWSSPVLTNVTIAGNTAAEGSQLYQGDELITVHNSIIFGSGTSPVYIYVDGENPGSIDAKNSLVTGINSSTKNNLNAAAYVLNDIFFNPAAGDYTLKAGSPAIDAGSNALYGGNTNTDKDLAGNPRLFGTAIDLGPYEKQTQQQTISPIAAITKTYGDADFKVEATSTSGRPIAFSSADPSVVSITADGLLHIKSAGTGIITASEAVTNTDDEAAAVNFTVTVNPKILTVTATGLNKVYDASPSATVTLSDDRINNDELTILYTAVFNDQNTGTSKTVSVSSMALSGTMASSYVLSAATALTVADITPLPLNYIATPVSIVYGDAIPEFTGTVTGFLASDTQASVTTGTLGFNSNAGPKNVGSYAVNGSGLTATNGNYILAQAPENTTAFRIIPASLTYTATPVSKKQGAPNPTFTGTLTGFIGNETEATSTTGTRIFSSTATPGSPKGSYAINGGGLTAINDNYEFVQAGSNSTALTIDEASVIVAPATDIIYVKKSITTGDFSGSSWANATPELARALLFAKTNNAVATNPQVTQIWVAGGIYKPMYSPEDGANFGKDKGRDNTFLMVKDVKIYGGFAGTETKLAERNLTLTANKSTLSGDLNGDDGSDLTNNGENTYHVLVAAFAVGSAEINGFTISGGNGVGGGFLGIKVGSEYINPGYGAAFFNLSSSPAITNVTISGNNAPYGGAFGNFSSSPVLTNVTISGNSAVTVGGTFYNNASSPVLTNVTISGNKADRAGVFYNGNNSSPKILNAIIYNNEGTNENDWNSAVTYQHSLVEGNPNGNDMIVYSDAASNIFVNPQAPGLNIGGDYSLKVGSPGVNKGDNALFTGLVANTTDLAGNLRLQKGTIDLGAYESPYNSVSLAANGIIYVKKGETGNGSSWADALPELADALLFAKTNNAAATNPQVTQIWVAGGTYKPLYSPADDNFGNDDTRNNAFLLVKDVKIYGGFAGTETTLTERNLTIITNKSILSGDLNGDDGANFAANSENTYHIVISAGAVGTAELNGFTVSEANANGNGGITVDKKLIEDYVGGIFNSNSFPVLTNLTISGNTAVNAGGGMYNAASSPVLTNLTISGNTAANYGGGIYNDFSFPVLTNVTISNNTAGSGGGGMYNAASSPVLTNVTISGNTAANYGGGMYNYSSSPIIKNTIIYNNNTGVYNIYTSFPAYQYSLVEGNPSGMGMVNATGAATYIFVNPQNPGLSTIGDYTLKAGSPAINAGSNSFFDAGITPDLSSIITDLAGNPRIQKGLIDLGAYESPYINVSSSANSIIFVKKGETGNGSSWADAFGELADALVFAKTNNAVATNPQVTQIWVAGGIYKPMYSPEDGVNFGTDKARDNTFLLVKDVKIFGSFAGTETTLAQRDLLLTTNKTTLSGDLNGDDGANFANNGENTYHVVLGAGAVGIAEVNGFTVSGGNGNGNGLIKVNSSDIYSYAGGAFFNQDGFSPVLTNISVVGNSAYYGGAFLNIVSSPILTNVSISGNNSDVSGGAFYNDISSPILTNVTISGNSANYGGAFYNYISSPILTNVTISGNRATQLGGAFYNNNSSPKISNSIIYNNDGTDLQDGNSVPSYVNSLVQGNPAGTDMVPYSGDASTIFVDPQAPGLNAGGDYRLKAGSPALNKGNNALFAGLDANTKDLAGNLRLQNGAIDLGAYEGPYLGILPDANGILYVKKGEMGNGSSWADALPELADALLFAKTNNATATNPQVKQIWVAGGIYKPMYSPEDGANFGTDKGRDNTFLLVKDVQLYGSFAGTETTLAQRDLSLIANKTTLSGDLNGDDGANFANNGENAYHVMVGAGAVGTAEVNGFTVSGGNGNGNSWIIVNSSGIDRNTGGAFINRASSPVLTNLWIGGNSAKLGGAFFNRDSSPVLTNLTIIGNSATDYGGAFYNGYFSPVLTNVTISGNRARYGGAFYNAESSPVLTNVTVSGNSATLAGGAFYNYISYPKIYNSIIYNNDAADWENGGVSAYVNSLVQGNPTGTDMVPYSGDASDIFVNPQAPGVNTAGDYRLKEGSPAINKGNNALFAGLDADTKDLVGNLRLQKGTIDLGAYESLYASVLPIVDGMLYVKKGETGNGSSWASAFGEVADALKFAKTNNALATNPQVKQIWVAGGIYKPMYSLDDGADFGTDKGRFNTFLLVKDVKIYGGFAGTETTLAERDLTLTANKSILSGDLSGDDGVNFANNGENTYHVVLGAGAVGIAEVNGFTVSGGNGNGTFSIQVNSLYFSGFLGGAFYNQNGSSPVLTNVIISGNSAYYGGAFYNENSSPVLINVSISGNSATDNGGAFFNQNGSSPVLTNVTISGNNADYGGAFLNMNSSPVLTNVTISGNRASTGGAFYNNNSFPKIRNSIIYNNDAADIQWQGSVPAYLNSIVQGNPTGTDMVPYSGDATTIFVNPQAPGVNTAGNYRLKEGSPAINKGNNTLFAGLGANTKDLAGNLRLQNGAIDLGAYESPYWVILPNANGILYVKKGETGNGSNWTNALGELADALLFAKINNAVATNTKVTQIWAAGGIYKPMYSPEDGANFGTDKGRDNTFLLVKDVQLYGGFAGTETTLAQRDLALTANKSILSGDLSGDDGANFANNGENAYHVVLGAGAVGIAEVNGFAVSGGYGVTDNGNDDKILVNLLFIYKLRGGAFNYTSSSPLLTQVAIIGNSAYYGGALFMEDSSPILTNVVVSGNGASLGGAIINHNGSSPVLTNVTISGNSADYGGAFFNVNSSPVLINNTISGNSAPSGGAFYNDNSFPKIYNSIIYNNDVADRQEQGSVPVYVNSLVQGNPAGTDMVPYSGDASNIFVNPLAPGVNVGGDYRLKAGSPALNKGNNALFAGLDANTKDLAGNSRLKGATIDLGAYELQSQSQTINAIATITKTYGELDFLPGATANSGLMVAYSSADHSIAEAYQDVADGNKWKIKIIKAGTVNITASQAGDGNYDPAAAVVFSLVIKRKPVTVILNPALITKTYDANANATISISNLSFASGSVVGTDDLSISLNNPTAVYDDKNVGKGKEVSLALGSFNLLGTAAGNYSIANMADVRANVGAITAKALTVKAKNQSKIYGGAPYSGGNGVDYIGFATDDNHINALNGILDYEGTSQQAIATGTYAIVPKGYTAVNYTITYVAGILTIAPSTVNVLNFNVQTKGATLTKTYGDGSIDGSAIASSNLTTSYQSTNVAVAAVNSAGQVEIKGTGTTVITANQVGNTNYDPATAINFTVVVVKKILDVKAKDDNKIFNNLPYAGGNGLVYAGFVYGENESKLGGTVSYSGTAQGAINTGSYQIIPSGLTATNYNLNYINGTLKIEATGSNVILFNSQTAGVNRNVTYGDGNIDASATATSGLPVTYLSSNPAVATVAADGTVTVRSAGTSTITANQAGDINHQAATSISFILNVQKRELTITANNFNKVYDAQSYTTGNDVTYTGFATGEGKQQLTGTLSYAGTAINAKDVGSYVITPRGYSSTNYAITYKDGSLIITKADIMVTANAQNKVYGDADPILTYKVTGLATGNTLTGTLSRTAGENAGNYAINQGSLSAGANYVISYTANNLTIGTKSITVIADAQSKVYGDVDPSLTYKVTGLIAPNVLTGTLTRTTGENVGNYAINQGSLSAGANYVISFTANNLTIGKKSITVIADAQSKVYGDVDPILTYKVTGLATGNTLTGTLSRTAGENVGNYAINQGSLSAGGNYVIGFTANNLTIGTKSITVIADAQNKVYGDADPTMTYKVTGLIAPNVLTGTLTRTTGENVGNYAINQGSLSAGANYVISYTANNLTIGKKSITVIADAQSKVFGDADPILTYKVTGLATGNTLTGTLSRTAGENVGNYAIGQGSLSAGANYVIGYTANNLTIGTKSITVIADAQSKVYGDADPSLTYKVTGLSAGSTLTGVLSRTAGENVGNYAIGQGSLSAGANYVIGYTANNLTIGAKSITVIADAQSKVYGDVDPILTYKVTGLIAPNMLTGTLTRTTGENVGNYAINQGSLSAGANYVISFTANNLTIGKKSITVIADAQSKVFGDADPILTYQVTGLATGNTLTGTLSRTAGENVGNYAINQGSLSAGANYLISFTANNLTIGAKSITVIADAQIKVYGDADPTMTYKVTGLIAPNVLTGTLTRTSGENVGNYAINQGSLSAGANYSLNFSADALNITKAVLTVTAENKQTCLQNNLPPLTLTYAGFRLGDNLGSLNTRPTVATAANNTSAAGTYSLIPSGGFSSNYSFIYVNGSLIIYAKPVASIANSKTNNVSRGETLVLTASGGTTFSWSNANGIISGQQTAVLTIRPTLTTTYTVTVGNANGCTETMSLTIEVRDDFQAIKANNLLTPNGDGINDVWVVENIDMYPNNVVTIFDKGGRILFTQKGYKNTWNGTVNGAPLAESTYYYVIDFGTDKLKQKGFITLIRQQ